MNKPKYLVWIRQLGKLCPQLWYDDVTNGSGQRKHKAVGEDEILAAFHKLTVEEADLGLPVLAEKYPADKCEYTS